MAAPAEPPRLVERARRSLTLANSAVGVVVAFLAAVFSLVDLPQAARHHPLAAHRGTLDQPRDRVLALTPFYAGLRLGEVFALDDIRLSARKGIIIVRAGKGGKYREVPIHPQLRSDLALWINDERPNWKGASVSDPLLLNQLGQRLGARGADTILGAPTDPFRPPSLDGDPGLFGDLRARAAGRQGDHPVGHPIRGVESVTAIMLTSVSQRRKHQVGPLLVAGLRGMPSKLCHDLAARPQVRR